MNFIYRHYMRAASSQIFMVISVVKGHLRRNRVLRLLTHFS
jgi:hypothetical protein